MLATFISLTAAAQSSLPQAASPAIDLKDLKESGPAAGSITVVTTAASSVTQTAAPPEPPQKTEPASTPEGAVGQTDSSAEVTAFDIVVRAPAEVKALIERHIELQRYRAVTDLDDSELARLIELAERNVRNLIGTLGYFSPRIDISRGEAAGQRPVIVVAIDPGPRTQVRQIEVEFAGDIGASTDADVIAQRQFIQRNWQLPPGQRFTQSGWEGAKTQALRDLVERRYPTGRVADSLADIDPVTNSAYLGFKLDSGPSYRLGRLEVSGIERYNPALVPRLARLREGAVYDQRELLQAQQRLAASGYFDSANVFINPDETTDPQATPVQVQVREAKLQKVILGVGLTTDSGPRASLEHTHQRALGTDWRAVTKFQLERIAPSMQTEWTSLPDEANWRWSGLARAERVDDNGLITNSQRLRFGRSQIGDRIDRNVYVQYDRARVKGQALNALLAADAGDGSAISGNYIWTGRYFDSVPFPARGYGLGFELGGGVTLSGERTPYLRTVGR